VKREFLITFRHHFRLDLSLATPSISAMNTKSLFILALASLLTLSISTQAADKLKVLVVTGGHGFDQEPFFQVFKDNTAITYTSAVQGKTSEVYDREDLHSYDCVVLYDMCQKITDAQKAKFLSLFDKGVGVVITHHAMCSYQDWPEFERVMGGKYLLKAETEGDKIWQASDYQHDVDMPVQIVAKDHPITAGLKDFTIHDEVYKRYRVQPGMTALITTTHPESGKPLAWYHTYKKSRVVFLQLGHDKVAYANPNYQQLLARSIQWAANK
jgi:type 1 glutamine amidotransferase